MWICPECGRKFVRNNQTHSCVQYHPEELFFGKSERIQNLYNILIDRVKEFGEVEVYSVKWNVSVRRLSMFLSILVDEIDDQLIRWLKQAWELAC